MTAHSSIIAEIEKDRPRVSQSSLTRRERDTLIARGITGLYRWYLARSQTARNWDPCTSFDWRRLRRDHSHSLMCVIQGYYAVEQYAPDYTAELAKVCRAAYGRAQFQLRWGAEEAKHSDLWRNVLLFSGFRGAAWIDDYTDLLRSKAWALPYDNPLHMLLYTVLQERSTELNYLNTARLARGELRRDTEDAVLARVAQTIAVDEAAHYDFFLECARLYLYYRPDDTISALVDVMRTFTMPAAEIVPDYDAFIRALYDHNIFGRVIYARDILKTAFAALGIRKVRALEAAIVRSRQAPDADGRPLPAVDLESVLSMPILAASIERLFARIGRFEADVGLSDHDPTSFMPTSTATGSCNGVELNFESR